VNATYRLQLTGVLGFDQVRALLPYFRRLGISHLYLSPITEARPGSTHGYDVTDHNRVRTELGGREGFERLLAAAQAHGLGLILDFVPNHEGVGPANARWQDLLMFGPYSPYARYFDVDWDPLKPELYRKILLPFLGSPYGESLDRGDIRLVVEDGRILAAYYDHRFPLTPSSYAEVLALAEGLVSGAPGRALAELRAAYQTWTPGDRARAEALRPRLAHTATGEIPGALAEIGGEGLHRVLDAQFWRLAYWKTAAQDVNYRRFFDHNDLVALRMEDPQVFAEVHRMLGGYVAHPAVAGVRVDHVDGLLDPSTYLERLKALGTRHVWVEKILARGETLLPAWPVEGTTGYEFLNDMLGVLLRPGGELPVDRIYRRFLRGGVVPYWVEEYRSKRLVMETNLAGELVSLAYELDRISEADYHTRDFTYEALRQALAEFIALFPRYRTYLPENAAEAEEVVREVVQRARRRNFGRALTVYTFLEAVILGRTGGAPRQLAAPWVARLQQYTAPVTAKGVEDTAFYRYLRLSALNEVGGGPDRWGVTTHAFHARARFRALRYPHSLLATATHDTKRGEDTRMRLIVLAEMPEAWARGLRALARIGRRHRRREAPSRADEYLLYQTLVALWDGEDRGALPDRLSAYMQKAAREAKLRTSWLDPDLEYEAALERLVRGLLADGRLPPAVGPLAEALAAHGLTKALSQLIVKTTAPGTPDFYQGTELLDLSLVDPDNRRPVDFATRARMLEEMEPLLDAPDPAVLRDWIRRRDPRIKLFLMVRLLRFRQAHPGLFAGGYWSLEADGEAGERLLAYTRESGEERLLVAVPRFPAAPVRGDGELMLPLDYRFPEGEWTDVLTGAPVELRGGLDFAALPLGWAVLFRGAAAASDTEDTATSGGAEWMEDDIPGAARRGASPDGGLRGRC
jgi:(1->4)-alpha-D-glucan 1-alpha-D-glucosylmutase